MKYCSTFFLLLCTIPSLFGAVITAPNGGMVFGVQSPYFLTRDQLPDERYQEVFNNTPFLGQNPGPFYITELSYDVAQGSLPIDVTLSGLDIRMSTTQVSADHHTGTFAANVGPDETLVYSGALRLYDSGGSFGVHIPLQHAFLFNPQLGNLVVDIWNYQTILRPASGGYYLNTALDIGDDVSIVQGRANASTGSLGTAGVVTRFKITDVPEPSTAVLFGTGSAFALIFGNLLRKRGCSNRRSMQMES